MRARAWAENTLAIVDAKLCAVRAAHDQIPVTRKKIIRHEIELVTSVRTAIDVTVNLTTVPEPTTVLLLGLGGLACFRKRR